MRYRRHGAEGLRLKCSPGRPRHRGERALAELERILDAPRQLKPRAQGKRVHLVLDNGPIHHSRLTRSVLEQEKEWLRTEWLPPYAPELNDTERDWKHLKEHYLAHQTFVTIDRMERAPSTRASATSTAAAGVGSISLGCLEQEKLQLCLTPDAHKPTGTLHKRYAHGPAAGEPSRLRSARLGGSSPRYRCSLGSA
jgi:transposase